MRLLNFIIVIFNFYGFCEGTLGVEFYLDSLMCVGGRFKFLGILCDNIFTLLFSCMLVFSKLGFGVWLVLLGELWLKVLCCYFVAFFWLC